MKNELNIINEVINTATSKGIIHLYTEDDNYDSNVITVNGKSVINFGSCSYLGLEFDHRLINAGSESIKKYGTQFSASRAYVSCGLYKELENRFEQIFGGYCVVAPTTTLGHIATIPTIVENNDVIILDHQVHASVQNAVQLLKPKGVKVEMIRHNRMDLLEDRINFLRTKYDKIWYMADGIYSMFGDKAPLDEIYTLMDKYPEFHFYVDDAHGMSCYGDKGQGYVLANKKMHSKMVLATSLAKAFATGGSVFVFADEKMREKVMNCGGPLITSGPMQPAALGAAIASADIHLSKEICAMQEELQDNIKYTNLLFKKMGLPLVSDNNTPVFFLGVGLPKVGYNLVKRMLGDGMYTNLGIFPAVPMKNTGVRFTITRLHTFEQIEKFVKAIAYHYPKALAEEGYTISEVKKVFRMKSEENKHKDEIRSLVNISNLKLEHTNSIATIDKKEWDHLFKGKGSFDWDGVRLLEETFKNNLKEEDNWVFDYFMIRDLKTDKLVLSTFTTTSLSKDDLFSGENVSKELEERRKVDPYYLTTKVVSLGSSLTIGEHLYLDKFSEFYKEAMEILLNKITEVKDREKAGIVMLRDFSKFDKDLDSIITNNGYFKAEIPETNILNRPVSGANLLNRVSVNRRRNLRKQVFAHHDKFETNVVRIASEEQIEHWYKLYCNLKDRKFELNTFKLPFKLFENIAKAYNWEVVEISLKKEFTNGIKQMPVSVVFSYISGDSYNPMILGMDFAYKEFNVYQQSIYTTVKRAEKLKLNKVYLGMTSSFEKHKFDAEAFKTHAYMQIEDHYNMEVIQGMSNNKKTKV